MTARAEARDGPSAFEVRAAILRGDWTWLTKGLAILILDLQGRAKKACTLSPKGLAVRLNATERSVKRALAELGDALEITHRGAAGNRTAHRRLLGDVVLGKWPPPTRPKGDSSDAPVTTAPHSGGAETPTPVTEATPVTEVTRGGDASVTGGVTPASRVGGDSSDASVTHRGVRGSEREEEGETTRAGAREDHPPSPPSPDPDPGSDEDAPTTDDEHVALVVEAYRTVVEVHRGTYSGNGSEAPRSSLVAAGRAAEAYAELHGEGADSWLLLWTARSVQSLRDRSLAPKLRYVAQDVVGYAAEAPPERPRDLFTREILYRLGTARWEGVEDLLAATSTRRLAVCWWQVWCDARSLDDVEGHVDALDTSWPAVCARSDATIEGVFHDVEVDDDEHGGWWRLASGGLCAFPITLDFGSLAATCLRIRLGDGWPEWRAAVERMSEADREALLERAREHGLRGPELAARIAA